jgi:hypothetical protein
MVVASGTTLNLNDLTIALRNSRSDPFIKSGAGIRNDETLSKVDVGKWRGGIERLMLLGYELTITSNTALRSKRRHG